MKYILLILLCIFPQFVCAQALTYDQWVLAGMNNARVSAGVEALSENRKLNAIASYKAMDMYVHNYFSHPSLSGHMTWDYYLAFGYDFTAAGENLARGYTDPITLVNAYMSSPGHRENILNPVYTEVGIASFGPYEAVEFGRQ